MNPQLEQKIIEACIKSGFKPRQHGYDDRFIESRDKYKTFHILSNRRCWIYLCDRYLHKKENRIMIKKVGKYGQVINGVTVFDRGVDSIKFFKKILNVIEQCHKKYHLKN